MNNQQPGFADPVTSYGDRRPINTDPREQPGFVPPAFNPDPREQPHWPPAQPPLVARPPQPGRSPWFWTGISAVILVVIFGGLASASVLLTHTITAQKTFTVGSAPKLVITVNSGDVHITSGQPGQISLVARERVFLGSNDQIPIQYQPSPDPNTLTINVNQQPSFSFGCCFFSNSGIDLQVTVPSQTTLNIHADSGDITTRGVSAPMTLTTSSGDITTDGGSGQITLTTSSGDIITDGDSGQITLTTSSGDIRASNVNGQMALTASSGDITVSNASASGTSSIQTSSGDISYHGSLAANGSYEFRANSGDVNLTLPADAAFQVQATTDSGDIRSDFSGVSVLNDNGSGATASGGPGSGPSAARITIQTSSGDINISKA